MAKRGLCILLAVLTVFSLAIPAFAADGGVEENEPVTAATKVLYTGNCGAQGDNLTWTLTDDGVLTISGKGRMKDYEPGQGGFGGLGTKKAIIESGVTSIGVWAFGDGDWVESVTIPDTVTSIGKDAFTSCGSLTEINVASGNKNFVSVDGVVYTADMKKLVAYPGGRKGSYAVPEGVTEISAYGFYECMGLTGITFPKTLEKIGESAFLYCYGLSGDLVFPARVSSIGAGLLVGTDVGSVTILNPTCSIGNSGATFGIAVIHGYDGSTAEAYAKENGYTFKSLNLSAPKLGKVTSTDGGVKISWGKVSGAAKYRVYYKGGDAKSWTKIADVTGTSYTWTKAKTRTNYSFTVKAYDKQGIAGKYDKTGVSLIANKDLTAPTVKIAQTKSGIQVSWNAVSGSSRYMVYYKENGGSWQRIGDTAKTSYTRAAKYLKAGATYQFTVRCCASDKKTLLSTYKASNKVKYTVELAAPTVKIAQTDGGIQVTWNAVKGSPRYMVYYKENGGSWQRIGDTAKTSYTRAAKYLKAGAAYQFTVRCCASDKKTLLSTYKASNKVKYTVELAAPTVKIAQTDGGIQVTWNAVKGSSRYMVYYKENGGTWQRIGDTAKTSYTRAAKYLKNGATYQFTVRCCASDGKTLLSAYQTSNKVTYTK